MKRLMLMLNTIKLYSGWMFDSNGWFWKVLCALEWVVTGFWRNPWFWFFIICLGFAAYGRYLTGGYVTGPDDHYGATIPFTNSALRSLKTSI